MDETAGITDEVESEFAKVGRVLLQGGRSEAIIAQYRRHGGDSGKRMCLARVCHGGGFHLATHQVDGVDVCTRAAKKWGKRVLAPGGMAASLKGRR